LTESDELLATYGGHTAAAGLSFAAEHLDALRAGLNRSADAQLLAQGGLPAPQVTLDGTVELGDLDDRFVRDLRRLAPFGMGNAEPVFLAERTYASRARIVGSDHLRARYRDSSGALDGIGFSLADREPLLESAVAIAFSPRYSTFRGRSRLEMHVRDIRPASSRRAAKIYDRVDEIDA
jgi:single-stranded-DNA-specific exonuclease